MTPAQTIPASEGAERAHVCVRTIRRWVREGKISGYTIGGRNLRVDPAEIDALFERVEVTA